MSAQARATCWITGRGSNGRENLKPFAGSAPMSSPRAWHRRWNWRAEVGVSIPGTALAQGLLKKVLEID